MPTIIEIATTADGHRDDDDENMEDVVALDTTRPAPGTNLCEEALSFLVRVLMRTRKKYQLSVNPREKPPSEDVPEWYFWVDKDRCHVCGKQTGPQNAKWGVSN